MYYCLLLPGYLLHVQIKLISEGLCSAYYKRISVLACYHHCSIVANFLKILLLIHQDFNLLLPIAE